MSGIGDWIGALAGERAGRAETGMRLQQRKDARHAGFDQPGSMGICFGNVRKCGFIYAARAGRAHSSRFFMLSATRRFDDLFGAAHHFGVRDRAMEFDIAHGGK